MAVAAGRRRARHGPLRQGQGLDTLGQDRDSGLARQFNNGNGAGRKRRRARQHGRQGRALDEASKLAHCVAADAEAMHLLCPRWLLASLASCIKQKSWERYGTSIAVMSMRYGPNWPLKPSTTIWYATPAFIAICAQSPHLNVHTCQCQRPSLLTTSTLKTQRARALRLQQTVTG